MFLGILLLPVFGPENVTGQKSCPVIILGSYIHICTHKPRHLPEDEVDAADPRLSAFQALGHASLGGIVLPGNHHPPVVPL